MRLSFSLIALILVLVAPPRAQAVAIASEPGNGNTTAPADDPGFGHVGSPGIATVVYPDTGARLSVEPVDLSPASRTAFTLGG